MSQLIDENFPNATSEIGSATPSISIIPPTDEKINTSDEKNSKPLNDEAQIGAENVDKHSQDELRATLEDNIAHVHYESEDVDPKKENGALDKGASGEKYFINLSTDNELSKRLQGTYGSKKYKEIQQYIIDTLDKDPIIINNGLSVIIDNRDAQHIAHNAVGEKIAQIYHIKDLLTSATLFAEDKNVEHNKFYYFSYHEVYVKYKEDIYPVYFNIGKGISDQKHHVYDITKKIGDTANRINGLERPKPNEGYAQKNDISTYSITSIKEKINTSDEKNSKPLNDEDPPMADSNEKLSQDELRATLETKVADVVDVLKINQKEKNLSIATPNLFSDMPEVLTINSITENYEKVNTLDKKIHKQ